MTEGALATKRHVKLLGYALSLTRLRRELPPGGSLWHNTLLPKKLTFFCVSAKPFLIHATIAWFSFYNKTPAPINQGRRFIQYKLRGLLICDKLYNKECRDRKRYSYGEADPHVLNESCHNEHHEGYCRNCYSVGHLGGYMVQMVATTARRGHNGSVRNG